MPVVDGRVPSNSLGDRTAPPRSIDPQRNYYFGDGTGTGLVLPVKTSTGNPASPVEGQVYVNMGDNAVRVYADGMWRDLATW